MAYSVLCQLQVSALALTFWTNCFHTVSLDQIFVLLVVTARQVQARTVPIFCPRLR